MAYHYTERGHSPMIVGALYSRTTSHHYLYKLKKHNAATGMCKMESAWWGGSCVWISEVELSNWHLISREQN